MQSIDKADLNEEENKLFKRTSKTLSFCQNLIYVFYANSIEKLIKNDEFFNHHATKIKDQLRKIIHVHLYAKFINLGLEM